MLIIFAIRLCLGCLQVVDNQDGECYVCRQAQEAHKLQVALKMVKIIARARKLKRYPIFSACASKFYDHGEDSYDKENLYAELQRQHILILCFNELLEVHQQNAVDADQEDLS